MGNLVICSRLLLKRPREIVREVVRDVEYSEAVSTLINDSLAENLAHSKDGFSMLNFGIQRLQEAETLIPSESITIADEFHGHLYG